jgi:WD40 repeat protein
MEMITVAFARCTAPPSVNLSMSSLHQLLRNKISTKTKPKWSGKIACVKNKDIIIFDTISKSITRKLPHKMEPNYIIQLENGFIASGNADGNVYIWDIRTGKLVKTLTGHSDTVFDICELKNNKLITEGAAKVIIFDMSDGSVVTSFDTTSRITSFAKLQDSTLVCSGKQEIFTFDIETKNRSSMSTNALCYHALTELKNGAIICCGFSGSIEIVDIRTKVCTIKVGAYAFSPIVLQQGGFATLESFGKNINVWSEAGTLIKKFENVFKCYDDYYFAKIAEVECDIIACQKNTKLVFCNICTGNVEREIEIGEMDVRCFLK